MDDGKAPAPKPDMMEQAGDLMKRFAKGEAIAGTLYRDRQSTIVIASAVLAVAGELRDIHNVLVSINSNLNETHHLLDDLTIVEFGDSPDGPETLCYRYLRIGLPR